MISVMLECPVCSKRISIVVNLLLMRRKFICKNCGALLKVDPRSVVLINIIGGSVTALLGFLAGISQQGFFLIALFIWIPISILLYINFARLILAEEDIPQK